MHAIHNDTRTPPTGEIETRASNTGLPLAARRRAAKQRRITETLERFDSLPDEALVEIGIVTIVRGRSPASIWRDVAAGRLARPLRVGARSTRWRVGDVRRASREG